MSYFQKQQFQHLQFETPSPAATDPFEANPFADPAELSPSEELAILDPLSTEKPSFQSADQAVQNSEQNSSGSNEMSIDDILLGGSGNPPTEPLKDGYSEGPSTPASDADHIASINQYFVPPNSVPESSSNTEGNPLADFSSSSTDKPVTADAQAQSNAVIPDCWIDSDSLMMPPPSSLSASSSEPQSSDSEGLAPKKAIPEPLKTQEDPPPVPKPAMANSVSETGEKPLTVSTEARQQPQETETSDLFNRAQKPADVPARAPTQKESTTESTAEPDLDAIRAFLKGAEIEDLKLPSELEREFFTSMGRLFRLSVEGLVEILRARTDIKSAFRMSMTTIRPVENNPLKFSINTDDALNKLLLNPGGACLPTEQAFNEAFDDIKAHELAVMAGMQAALNDLLKRFEPDELANYFEKRGGKSLLQQKKSWYWDQYIKQHQEILDRAEDQFQELFGEAFTTAYENQTSKLKETRQ